MASKEKYVIDRRCVMKIDGNIVIAYNTDRPYPTQIDPVFTPSLRRMHLPIYESRVFPYLCAAPATPQYSGAILGRLAQTVDQFPVVQTGNRFSLDPKLAARWRSLEQALMGVALFLLKDSPEPVVPLEYRFPPPPHRYGYMESFSTAPEARKAIQQARDAFQPLIAHAAWSAILHRSNTFWSVFSPGSPIDQDLDERWVKNLKTVGKVSKAWLQELLMSSVCDFSIKRSGLILRNPKEWLYSSKLVGLILSNVPVWILWGHGSHDIRPLTWTADFIAAFGPSEYEAQMANDWISAPKTPKAVPKPLPFNVMPKSPESGKGVRFGNVTYHEYVSEATEGTKSVTEVASLHVQIDIHEWIKKKEEFIVHAMATAEQSKVKKWKQRQEDAKAHKCPGQRGAVVYEWDRDEHQNPTQTRVSRANVEQAWSMFADQQRWYNCVANEWELCRDLDPMATTDDNEEDYPEYDREWEVQPDVAMDQWLSEDKVDLEPADALLHAKTFVPEDIAVQRNRDVVGYVTDAFDLVSVRFGYAYCTGSKYETYAKTPIKLNKALRIIGDGFDQPLYTMTDGAEASFIQYIMYLDAIGHPNIDLAEVPSALCDLYPDNPSFLGNQSSTVLVQRAVHSNMTLYIIRHRYDHTALGWELAVKDPCTALQCVRSRPTSMMEVVRELIDSKTAFYTLKPVPEVSTKDQGRVLPKYETFVGNRIGLGARTFSDVLDLTDYIAYEAVKMKLLEDKRIARAVVKRGGIISRLATGLVDEYDVLDGPDWKVDGKSVRITIEVDGEKREYFDDDISVEELATFVGLYSFESEPMQYAVESFSLMK